MHGRGGGGEEGRRSRHMWPVPDGAGLAAASPRPVNDARLERFADGFFLKDGRKIHIGDCALFQSGNSPAFIGIIRSLSSIKEDFPKLIVNWLYRPADIKLSKGILLEAAPNEVFYSFHKDEISAGSLLHPCKVAFLRKGVELPSGISSFVCRRVYDIANKCLWWLTDQDYINERQEEVDQLLDKTLIDMNAAVQSGGKQLNGSTPLQQLKSSSDSVQNSSSSGSMHVKGKRRDKVEHSLEPVKREHVMKADDGNSGNLVLDGLIKDEVAKITDKGGLVDAAGVDKLIGLMQLVKDDRKIDLAGRLLLADVIAATSADKFDCLGRFVQQKGLLVLDDWLQEAHKGKFGDGSSPKEGDKSLDELVLSVLRALDKLPVNLHALQTSNIGKSVNNLRNLKNLEIQKKAKVLVDTWKKRVDAEIMKGTDVKFVGSGPSVSWPGKPSMSESGHGCIKRIGDLPSKISNQASSTFKNLPVKPGHGDTLMKSITTSPGSKPAVLAAYPVANCAKEAVSRVSVTGSSNDSQLTPVKEEKSSASSQSPNNHHAPFAIPAKTLITSRKDDVRSSNSGSLNGSKVSGGLGRLRKSSNAVSGVNTSGGASGMQKEPSYSKFGSLSRAPVSNKMPVSGATTELVLDPPVIEHANGHRLIVRLPNPGKSPARSSSGGSFEEIPAGSRASSPSASEKYDQNDLRTINKEDACQANDTTETNAEMSNDRKSSIASFGNAQSFTHQKSSDAIGKLEDVLKDVNALAAGRNDNSFPEPKSRKEFMNALIESCVKSPDACASFSAGDDLGMNLLASVATEEILNSEFTCSESSLRGLSEVDGLPNLKDDKMKLSDELDTQVPGQYDRMDVDPEKNLRINDINTETEKFAVTLSDDKNNGLMQEGLRGGNKTFIGLENKSEMKPALQEGTVMISHKHKEEYGEVNEDHQMHERHDHGGQIAGMLDDKCKARSTLEDNRSVCCPSNIGTFASTSGSDVTSNSSANVCHTTLVSPPKEETVEVAHSCHMDMDTDKASAANENPVVAITIEQEQSNVPGNDINIANKTDQCFPPRGIKTNEVSDALKSNKPDCADNAKSSEASENNKKGMPFAMHGELKLSPAALGGNGSNLRKKDVSEDASLGLGCHEDGASFARKETRECSEPDPSNVPLFDQNGNVDQVSSCDRSHMTPDGADDVASISKLDFDLNEGISTDEVIQGEVANATTVSSNVVASQPSLAPVSIPTLSRGCPVTVTIAAPAKGPFMPPENLSRSKDEPGWKGSAATSAFRPAEPRKTFEMPIGTSGTSCSAKQSRASLDIDLNVADGLVMEDIVSHRHPRTGPESCTAIYHEEVACNVGMGLDLNKADESLEVGQNLASSSRIRELSQFPVVPFEAIPNGETNSLRDFDLNDGPGTEPCLESVLQNQPMKNSILQFLPTVNSLRVNSAESGNLSSWFSSGTAYPAVAISPFLSDRGDSTYPVVAPTGAQRYPGPAIVGSSFGGDPYRGAVLTSSPAMPFTAANPYTLPGFQFPSGFPLNPASFGGISTVYGDSTSRGTCLPTSHSQLGVGPANAASSPYVRPYVISLSDSSASGGGSEGARKWGGQNLDLNSGPNALEMESRGERLPSSHPMPITSQALFSEEVGRIYQVAGGGFKRKEPDVGWDMAKFSYKQSPWQ